MFEKLKQQPDDPIIQLLMQATADSSPNVVDLSAGVFKDEAGNTPVMQAVRDAEPRRLDKEKTRTYQGILGDERFDKLIADLILGEGSKVVLDGRVSTLHTVAGSAAILMAGHLIREAVDKPVVWAGKPTWANHYPLLKTAGVDVQEYPYYDYQTSSLDFDAMMSGLKNLRPGSVVLFHGCCHNPSGADLSPEQWDAVTGLVLEKDLVPFVDVAYQGLGQGLEEDAYGWRQMAEAVPEMLISYSCSKNFSLYRDRIGALTVLSKDSKSAEVTQSNMMRQSRATYSMPAAHGAFLVAEILQDSELRRAWESELSVMRNRINQMRSGFTEAMSARGLAERFGFVANQFGMFSFLGISEEEVIRLRNEYSIYMLESSRISIAGLTSENLDYVADSLVAVLEG